MISFSSFTYKSVVIDGQCDNWRYFSTNSLSLPLPTMHFSKLSYFFEIYDLISKEAIVSYGQCDDPRKVEKIAGAIQTNSNYVAKCGQHVLRVISCRGNTIVCLNCKANCPSSSLCPGNALVINSCQQCSTSNNAVAGASVLGFQLATVYFNLSILSMSTVSTSISTITVSVIISKPGTVHCASFSVGTTIASVSNIKMSGSQVAIANSSVGYVTMTGLSAETVYDVYCCAEDFSGNIMSLNETLLHSVSAKTACCRAINLLSTLSQIEPFDSSASQVQVSPIAFSLNSYPSKVAVVTVNIRAAFCTGTTIVLPSTNATGISTVRISPTKFLFHQSSSSLVGEFMISSITPGCYLLSISSEGSDVYQSVNDLFYCQGKEQPPVPRLQTVQLSNDGTSLLFIFDSETNQGTNDTYMALYAFDCQNIVFFPGSSNSSCVWLSHSQLSATVRSSSVVNVGDEAGILGKTITAKCRPTDDCSTYLFCAESNASILAPSKPIRPTVYLSSSHGFQINCNDVILDATQSTGSGIQDWRSIEWTVVADNSLKSISLPRISNYLNQFSKQHGIRSPITVPATLFDFVNSQFTFTLRLENFLMQSAYASVVADITNTSKITATVRLLVPNVGVYAGSAIRCIAIPTVSSKCLSISQMSTLTFNWQIFKGINEDRGLYSTDPNPSVFSLAPYSLDAGGVYVIKVSMFTTTTSVTISTSSTIVQVMIAGVVAVIQGGLIRRITVKESIYLDGSSSFDKDFDASSSIGLSYRWSCIVQYPLFASPCGNFTLSTASELSIPPSTFSPGTYNMSLLVSNPVVGTTATAVCQIFVSSSKIPSPEVLITTIGSMRNPNLPLIIVGTVNSNSIYGPVNATWISSIGSQRLSSIATTPISAFISTMNAELQLGLDIQGLSFGVSYLFTLRASYLSSPHHVESSSSIVVTINSPPQNGQLSMSPSFGLAMITVFSFTTSSWTDDPSGYPFQYVLGFYINDPIEFSTVKSLSILSYAKSFVSSGLSSNGYVVVSAAQAFDALGAGSNVSAMITVQPTFDSAVILSAAASAVSAAYATYDPAAVIGTISAAAGSLIQVEDCAVPVTCAFINRESCRATTRTCGQCVYGYIGPAGDSNTPCPLPSSTVGTGGFCESSSGCASGSCLNSTCIDSPKSCHNQCSSMGACVYTDVNDKIVRECLQSNIYCRAICQCFAGAYGEDCSMSLLPFRQKVQFNDFACSNLARVVKLQAVSTDVVAATATAILQVLEDVTSVSISAVTNCTAALISTVVSNPTVSCGGEAQVMIIRAFSALLDTGTLFPSSLYTSVSGCISKLSVSCQQNMAVSQSPIVFEEKNIRMQTILLPMKAAVESVYRPPLSKYLELMGASVGTITLSSLSLSNYSNIVKAVGLTVIEYVTKPQRLPVNASIIRLEISYYKAAQVSSQTRRKLSTQSALYPLDVTVTLPNNQVTMFTSKQEVNETYVCMKSSSTPILACRGNTEINVTCPQNMTGYFRVRCPTYSTRPLCKVWGENQQSMGDCSVVTYNKLNTTCRCAQKKSYAFSSDPLTLIQEFSVYTETVTQEAVVSFYPYPAGEKVQNNEVVLPFIYALGSLYVLVAVVLLRLDVGEMSEAKATRDRPEQHRTIRTIAGYFNSIVPANYKSEHLNKLSLRNTLELHRWTKIFYLNIRIFPWFSLFITTMSAISCSIAFIAFFCPDDGTCERILAEAPCENAGRNILYVGLNIHYCGWKAHTNSCSYRSDAFFNATFVFVADLILLVATNTVSKLCELSLPHHLFGSTSATNPHNDEVKSNSNAVVPTEFPLEGSVAPENPSSEKQSPFRYDEFVEWKSVPLMFLQAARLEKAKNAMDYLHPLQEANIIHMKARTRRQEMAPVKTSRKPLLLLKRNEKKVLAYECPVDGRTIFKRVVEVRKAADSLSRDINNIGDGEREMYLLKHFIVNVLHSGSLRAFAEKIILSRRVAQSPFLNSAISFSTCAFVLAVVAAMIYSIVLLEGKVGSRAAHVFFTLTMTVLAQDILIIQPASLWIEWYGVRRPLANELNELVAYLRRRVKLVLSRRCGLVRDYGCFVQHFNPACRVARRYPALPVSKFLFSLGDYDVPLRTVSIPASLWSWLMNTNSFRPLLLLEHMPDAIKELVIIISVTIATNLFYIAMTQLLLGSSLSPTMAWVVFSIILSLVGILSAILVAHSQGALGKQSSHRAKEEAELLFSEIDKDSAVEVFEQQQQQQPTIDHPFKGKNLLYGHPEEKEVGATEEQQQDDTAEVNLDWVDERNLLATALTFSKPLTPNLKLASAIQIQNQRNVMNSRKDMYVPAKRKPRKEKIREDLEWTPRSKVALTPESGGPGQRQEELFLSDIPTWDQHHPVDNEMVFEREREEVISPDSSRRSFSNRAARRYKPKNNYRDNSSQHSGPGKGVNMDDSVSNSSPKFPTWN